MEVKLDEQWLGVMAYVYSAFKISVTQWLGNDPAIQWLGNVSVEGRHIFEREGAGGAEQPREYTGRIILLRGTIVNTSK